MTIIFISECVTFLAVVFLLWRAHEQSKSMTELMKKVSELHAMAMEIRKHEIEQQSTLASLHEHFEAKRTVAPKVEGNPKPVPARTMTAVRERLEKEARGEQA